MSEPQPPSTPGQPEQAEPMPPCPRCGNSRQVWRNQITGLLTCHRAYCDTVVPETDPNQLALDLPQ